MVYLFLHDKILSYKIQEKILKVVGKTLRPMKNIENYYVLTTMLHCWSNTRSNALSLSEYVIVYSNSFILSNIFCLDE